MLTAFDQIEHRMLKDSQAYFGESLTLIPMSTRPNKRPTRDRSRQSFDLTGVVYTQPMMSDLDKNSRIDRAGRGKSMSYNSASTKQITLNVQLLDLQWEPRQMDAVIRNGSGQVYEITNVTPSGHSDLNLSLSEVEGPFDVTA